MGLLLEMRAIGGLGRGFSASGLIDDGAGHDTGEFWNVTYEGVESFETSYCTSKWPGDLKWKMEYLPCPGN